MTLPSDDLIHAKRPSFLEFDFGPTYLPLCQITVPILTEIETISDNACSWSDGSSEEPLYEVTAQTSDEEQEEWMNTSELLASLLQPPGIGKLGELPGKELI